MGTVGDGTGKHYITKQQPNGTDVILVSDDSGGSVAADYFKKATNRSGVKVTNTQAPK